MGAIGCRPTGLALTEMLAAPEVRKTMRALRASGATRDEYVEAIIGFADPDVAATIREEFGVLPGLTVSIIVDAWALADAAGKRFEVTSVPPDEPIRFARNRRVRITVDVEDEIVTVALSHVATRHADWYGATAAMAR
jgi:hypothetical protein